MRQSFTEQMQQAKDVAAARRQRDGVGGGGKVYAMPAQRKIAASELDSFDRWLLVVQDRVSEARESVNFAILANRDPSILDCPF